MKLRSLLFAPGDSERKIEKALASAADAVILDLEDSVAPGQKLAARACVVAALEKRGQASVVVRVNAADTPWYLGDLAAITRHRPDAVMLPKCASAADLLALEHHLAALETEASLPVGGIGVLPIATESCAAVLALPSMLEPVVSGATQQLRAVCFGAEDLAADLGLAPRLPGGAHPAPIEAARAMVLLAAAKAGVPAIDTPFPDPRDDEGFTRELVRAKADGFTGKLCIHPSQIEAVNAAFTPDATLAAWAMRVMAHANAHPAQGVFTLDGQMIDRPHLRLAAEILARME